MNYRKRVGKGTEPCGTLYYYQVTVSHNRGIKKGRKGNKRYKCIED